MKLKIIFAFLIIQFSLNGQVSSVDSLETILSQNKINDTSWINSNFQLLYQYEKLNSPKFEDLCKQLINYSKKLDFSNGLIKGYKFLAYWYADHGQYEKALVSALERLKLCEKLNHPAELIDTYNILIFIYARSENIPKAIEYANIAKTKLLSLPKSLPNRYVLMGNIYSGLGNLYELSKQHSEAINIYKEVLENTNFAIKNNLIDSLKGNTLIASAYSNLAFFYYRNKEYTQSAIFAEKALNFSENHTVNLSKNSIYNVLVVSYSNVKKFEDAEYYLEKIKVLLDKQQATIDEVTAYYEAGKELYFKQNNFEKAFQFQSKLVKIKDSLQNVTVRNRINDLSIKYETEKKENENKFLNDLNISISKQNKYILIFSIFLILLLLITIIQNRKLYHAKNTISQTNEQLNIANNKKDTLFKIISHDLKTPASGFVHLINQVKSNIKNKEYDSLNDISNNAQKLANDLQLNINNLLYWSMSQQGIIDKRLESVYILDTFTELKESFGTYAEIKKIDLYFTYDEKLVLKANRIHFNTILRNIISNALKFTPVGGTIKVWTNELEQMIQINIEDSGTGFSDQQINDFEQGNNIFASNNFTNTTGTGLGLEISKELTKLYNGKISIMKSSLLGGAFVKLTFNK